MATTGTQPSADTADVQLDLPPNKRYYPCGFTAQVARDDLLPALAPTAASRAYADASGIRIYAPGGVTSADYRAIKDAATDALQVWGFKEDPRDSGRPEAGERHVATYRNQK